MFCFHFSVVAGNRLSRNLLYWSFASRAVLIGSASAPLFCQQAPQCSTVLVPALCVVGLPAASAGRSYLSGWVYHFPMSSSGYSFNTLDYSVDSLLVLGWRWLSHAHPPWVIMSAQVLAVVYLLLWRMWCDVRKHDEPRLTTYQGKKRTQTIKTHSNTRTHSLASKMLTLQY